MRRTEINNVHYDALCCQTDYKQIIKVVCHDWSRIAHYLTVITSREVITARLLNLKWQLHILSVYGESDKNDRRK